MKNVIFCILLSTSAFGQNTFSVRVRSAVDQMPIAGASISIAGNRTGITTDTVGHGLLPISTDLLRIRVSAVGFQPATQLLRPSVSDTVYIELNPAEEELDEVTVSTTRNGRTVSDEPSRIEVIDGEELDEKANMQPGNISVILRESPGIQVQQTSVTSANATFRIQGLDGRYTQLLQDGLPLYSGFSSGLSVLQIPPLNLKQVEVIKGCQSTLYGSGAIAGLVNLVTKEPGRDRDLSFLINGTSALGVDLNGYFAQRNDKVGVTFYATHNRQRPYDPNHDQFSDLPQIARTTLQPRFFWYPSPTTTLSAGLIWTDEQRTGGHMPTIRRTDGAGYTEANDSRRLATQFRLEKRFANEAVLTLKNSYSRFNRSIALLDYRFSGLQQSSFTELSYFKHRASSDWIVGLNGWTDTFLDQRTPPATPSDRVYSQKIAGVFLQNTQIFSERFSLETGLRADIVGTRTQNTTNDNQPKAFLLPRLSLLYRVSEHWTSRLGGGLGYKAPTIFTEEAERLSFRGVELRSLRSQLYETSTGLNWDINYRTELGNKTTLSLNQLFFYTRLNRLTTLTAKPGPDCQTGNCPPDSYEFQTADGYVNTRGFETNVRFVYHNIHAFVGYSFIDTQRRYNGLNDMIPLTAKHRLYITSLYETDRLKTGFEAFYTGRQQRSTGTSTRPYWTLGYMIERKWSFGSVFVNFENFLDVRQSRYEPLVTGTTTRPTFVTDIYAPTDGRIINGGIKLSL